MFNRECSSVPFAAMSCAVLGCAAGLCYAKLSSALSVRVSKAWNPSHGDWILAHITSTTRSYFLNTWLSYKIALRSCSYVLQVND
jgi:hypothetical protein